MRSDTPCLSFCSLSQYPQNRIWPTLSSFSVTPACHHVVGVDLVGCAGHRVRHHLLHCLILCMREGWGAQERVCVDGCRCERAQEGGGTACKGNHSEHIDMFVYAHLHSYLCHIPPTSPTPHARTHAHIHAHITHTSAHTRTHTPAAPR